MTEAISLALDKTQPTPPGHRPQTASQYRQTALIFLRGDVLRYRCDRARPYGKDAIWKRLMSHRNKNTWTRAPRGRCIMMQVAICIGILIAINLRSSPKMFDVGVASPSDGMERSLQHTIWRWKRCDIINRTISCTRSSPEVPQT